MKMSLFLGNCSMIEWKSFNILVVLVDATLLARGDPEVQDVCFFVSVADFTYQIHSPEIYH
jgi:hypothetical protein